MAVKIEGTNLKQEAFTEVLNEESSQSDNEIFLKENLNNIKCEPLDDDFSRSNSPIDIQNFIKTELIEDEAFIEDGIKSEIELSDNNEDESPDPIDDAPSSLETAALLQARKADIRVMTGETRKSAKWYRCSLCPYQNVKQKNVTKHALIHQKVKAFKCDICSYECHWKSWMTRHRQKHDMHQHTFSCDQCSYTARFKICLDRHLMNHAKLKPFACSLCNYRGNSKGYLRSHLTTHSKIKPFSCPKCEYSCTRKKYLLLHIKSHSMKKMRKPRFRSSPASPASVAAAAAVVDCTSILTESGNFQCKICEYKCLRKTTLRIHLRRHFDPTYYFCQSCDYKTDRKDLLNSHKLTHNAVKRFECKECEFKSHWSHCLRRHMYVKHLEYRPFQCAECNYATVDKSNLKKHVANHFESLSCVECGLDFKTKSNMTRHKNKFHKIQKNSVQTEPEN